MIKVLKKWLENRFGFIIDFIPERFSGRARDGTLIAKILESYGVINKEELQFIEETAEPSIAYDNFSHHITKWLTLLNIELTETEIYEITHGEITTALNLFYNLYIELEESNSMNEVIEIKSDQRTYHVSPVRYNLAKDFFRGINPLCDPLLDQWDIVNWEKDHLDMLRMKYMKSRQDYSQYLDQKKEKELQKQTVHRSEVDPNLIYEVEVPPDTTYDDLIKEQERALCLEPFEPDFDKGMKMIRQLKRKRKKEIERGAVKIQMQKALLSSIWETLKLDEEVEFNKTVSEKLLQHSAAEKELAKKLFKIKRRKEIIVENRRKELEKIERRRDETSIRALFEENLKAHLLWHTERQALINLHRKLYEEKMRLKKLKNEKLCQDVMEDVVDLALKAAEFRQFYGFEPTKDVKRQWATLFIKQQPIFDLVTPVEDIKKKLEDIPDLIEETYHREVKRQDILDWQDFFDYLNFLSIWERPDIDDWHKIECGLNVLGFIVHRVLLEKYPLRIPLRPDLPEDIEIAVCANINTTERLDFLKRLLSQRDIHVILMSDAQDFCIQSYRDEMIREYDDRLPDELEDLKTMEATIKTDERGQKKGKKDKKKSVASKKSKKKSSKGSKKSSKKSTKDRKSKDEMPLEFEEKVVQTPRLFPWDKIVLTHKAELGQKVLNLIENEIVIEHNLKVKMFIEYLLSIKNLKGWVLINYPQNYEQAAILEEALTGKRAPGEYFDGILNETNLESIIIDDEDEEDSTDHDVTTENVDHPPRYDSLVTIQQEQSNKSILRESASKHNKIESGFNLKAVRTESKVQFVDHQDIKGSSNDSVKDDVHADDDNGKPNFTERMSILLPDFVFYPNKDNYNSSSSHLRPPQKKMSIHDITPIHTIQTCEQSVSEKNSLENQVHVDEELNLCSCTCNVIQNLTDGDDGEETGNVKECKCFESEVIENSTKSTGTGRISQETLLQRPPEITNYPENYDDLRWSKIVPYPFPLEPEEYKTPLTAYIKTIPKPEEDPYDGEAIPYFKELEKADSLEKFYSDQGCFYLLQHEEYNSDVVKCLAKLIIGDYVLPLKSSVELFGERYLEGVIEDGDITITRKGKKKGKKPKKRIIKEKSADKKEKSSKKSKKAGKGSKKSKKSKSSKGSKKNKKNKKRKKDSEEPLPPLTYEDKQNQCPEMEEEEKIEIAEPRAGEPGWVYINLPLPNDLAVALADFWENFESNYVTAFKELFFTKRVLLNAILPYIAQVKDTMETFLERPDEKQNYLHQFQKTFNDIDLDMRDDDETKNELLCQIDEFKEKLLCICDNKMKESEEERVKIVNTNWIYKQICEIVNNSNQAFQFEIDRFIDSVLFVNFYYKGIITKKFEEICEDALLYKVQIDSRDDCVDNEDACDEFSKFLIICDEDEEESVLQSQKEKNEENPKFTTRFHERIDQHLNFTLDFIDRNRKDAYILMAEMKKLFLPKKTKEKKKKKSKKDDELKKVFELDEEVKATSDRLFEEWSCALDGEFLRVIQRLNLIQNEMKTRLDEIIRWSKKVFCEIYHNISKHYHNESASVNEACKILSKSVTEEILIQSELVLESDKLSNIKIVLFPKDDETICYDRGAFTLDQLEFFIRILTDLAPSGYILEKTFLLLVQDVIFQDDFVGSEENDSKTDEDVMSRRLWRNLSTEKLQSVLKQLFDDNDYLYWKDFIICSFLLPFPTSEELMEVRQQFRRNDSSFREVVPKNDYEFVEFWYEKSAIDLTRTRRIKNLLYLMYRNEDDGTVNYANLLLDFCKDDDKAKGFAKALELSLGRRICYDFETGQHFVDTVLQQRLEDDQKERLREADHEFVMMKAERAVSLVIDRVIEECEGVTITEITTPPIIDEKHFENVSIHSFKPLPVTQSMITEFSVVSDEEDPVILVENRFSNIAIGFETKDDLNLAFFLPLGVVITVIMATVPWYNRIEEPAGKSFLDLIQEFYSACKNENFNQIVLTHEFLNHPEFKELFKKVTKFSAKNPVRLVKEIVNV